MPDSPAPQENFNEVPQEDTAPAPSQTSSDAQAHDVPPPGQNPTPPPADPTPTSASKSPGESEPNPFLDEQAQAAATQSPAEAQSVPEQRPQVWTQGDDSQRSATDLRTEAAPAMDKEAYERASSDAQKEQAAKESRLPNLGIGARVTFIKGDNDGRMGFVVNVIYPDALSQLIAHSGSDEARFADVDTYQVQTRDGRTDTIMAKPDEIRPLDINAGWGRGQF